MSSKFWGWVMMLRHRAVAGEKTVYTGTQKMCVFIVGGCEVERDEVYVARCVADKGRGEVKPKHFVI